MNTASNLFAVAVEAPPSPPAFSPDGTTLDVNSPAGAQIIDLARATWTKQSQTSGTPAQIGVARNGVRVANSIDLLTIKAGIVYQKDFLSGSGWMVWNNGWVASAAP